MVPLVNRTLTTAGQRSELEIEQGDAHRGVETKQGEWHPLDVTQCGEPGQHGGEACGDAESEQQNHQQTQAVQHGGPGRIANVVPNGPTVEAAIGRLLRERCETADVMAAPHRKREHPMLAHAFETERQRALHEPEARQIVAVPHERRARIADGFGRARRAHAALLHFSEICGALREAMRRTAHHVGEQEQIGDARCLFMVHAGSGKQACRERRERVMRTMHRGGNIVVLPPRFAR